MSERTTRDYLAIDLGAESGRLILGVLDGARLELREVHRFPNGPVRLPDGLHWDVLRLWSEIRLGLEQAAAQSAGGLCSLGLDTWGVDFALLDGRGRLLSNPSHYRDGRTDGMLAEAFRRVPRDEIFRRTGNQFMQINTLYQLLSLAVERSPLLEAADKLLMIPDLFNYWLSGQAVCEFSEATTSQCYDPQERRWAGPMLEQLGLPTRIFGEVVAPGAVLGRLQPFVAEGLKGPVPLVVAPACHDTASAVAAVPAENEHFAWISSGTWSIMGIESPVPVITPQTLEYNFTNEGGAGGNWQLSKNIMGLWLVQECRRTWAHQGEQHSFDELTRLAAEAEPFQALIDPDHAEFLKLGDMPGRVRAFCRETGQVVPESKGAVLRCILESIALKYRWVLEKLEALSGRRIEPVHIIGGGSKNRLLDQLTADATGRTVIAGPVEATAIGNILLQAAAQGHLNSVAERRAVVRASFAPEIYQPRPDSGWEEAYLRLQKVMETC